MKKEKSACKRVLMLNASHNDERMIQALKEAGCYVITTGNRPELKGHKLADKYVFGDYTDMDDMLQLAIKEHVDAVCPCCNDFGVKTAAYVSEKMGFAGQDPYEVTLTIHDKDRFKMFASLHKEIRTPASTSFDNIDMALDWTAKAQHRYPLIVKPVDLSAGNGIHRVDNIDELRIYIKEAFEKSRKKRIVIEPFIQGTQHGFCTFLKQKKVIATCSNNEYSFINPYRVEVDTFPSENVDIVYKELIEQIEFIAKELNLSDGIFHLQYIFADDGHAYILECMRRVLGNLYSVPAEGLGGGYNWDKWEALTKCNLPIEDMPNRPEQTGYWAYRALIANKNGTFRSVTIPKHIKEYIYASYMLHKPGYSINNFLSDPIGFLFFKFPDANTMKQICVEEYSLITVDTRENKIV